MKTLLAVDDDPSMLEIIETTLAAQGYRVLKAGDAEQAFQALRQNAIDLVLLDVAMPGKDGFAVYKELGALYSVPVLFVTGCPQSFAGNREDFVPLWETQFIEGTTDIVYKPFSLALLCEKVEALIGASEPANHGSSH